MSKNILFWCGILLIFLFLMNNVSNTVMVDDSLTYSDFISEVKKGNINSISVEGYNIYGKKHNGDSFRTIRPAIADGGLIGDLLDNGVQIEGKPIESNGFFRQLILAIAPILVIAAIFMFFASKLPNPMGGKGGPMGFGKSRAKMMLDNEVKTKFKDVAGAQEAKEEVMEIVEFLKEPKKFQTLGGKMPRGVLMVGPPGTGKTLLAKAIAGEAEVPFFSASGSDFIEMFVGVGASRVRDLFEQAQKNAPCLVFIDEIDAVGRSRGQGMGGGHDEREQTLNQMLVEMDGFEPNSGVIVIAATNRPEVLDKALLRSGRFDRRVEVSLPDIKGRNEILNVHLRDVPLSTDVNTMTIARATPGFSGADLANLVNEASIFAARNNKRLVEHIDMELAKDKILMGVERRSMVISDSEKLNTAYHEAGHVIVGKLMPEHDPVYKVSIIPRGRALGVTMFLPEEDRHGYSKQALISKITSFFGGRVAEKMLNGEDGITTGASDDIKRATQMARNMVTRWGYSDKLGPLFYAEDEEGNPYKQKDISDETAKNIDSEIKNLIDSCYQKAGSILLANRTKLEVMAQALMKYETIDATQIDEIMNDLPVSEPKDWNDNSPSSPPSSGVQLKNNTQQESIATA